ncbi:MAG: ABC transporter ATP-binding protein [Ruminococcaceae bacterium]|nr:ABC transporter ATP-binding protein [Oscillospiraceae bacterium]
MKLSEIKEALKLHARAIPVIRKYQPGYIASSFINNGLNAALPYSAIYFSARIIDVLSTDREPKSLLFWVILTVCTEAVLGVVSIFVRRWRTLHEYMLYEQDFPIYTHKALSMDFCVFDRRETADLLTQIDQNREFVACSFIRASMATDGLFRGAFRILGALILSVSLFTLPVENTSAGFLNSPLTAIVFVALLALSAAMGPVFIGKINSYYTGIAERGKMANRVWDFFLELSRDQSKQMDVRTYGQEKFVHHYERSTRFFNAEVLGPMGWLGGFAKGCGTVSTGLIYLFVCLKAWAGAFGIGAVTQYISAIAALSSGVNEFLEAVGDIRSNAAFLRKSFEFLDIPNVMYRGTIPTEKRMDREYEIEFRDVSFKYPSSDIWALRHVNVKFRVGKRLAVVGENGSGKTTFIKLLCRLYDPTEGQILLNGIDVRKYDYRDYLNVFSVVFQDFQLISQPLGANVAGSAEYDAARVTKCLSDAGFGERLATLPRGLDTMLYSDFGEEGINLSGGEAQKIAIARALYKNAPFIILDEPTAALDPIAEAEIYSRFNSIVDDKTAIFISHRLSSCRFCDGIVVFDRGSVCQQGTHEELVSKPGKYAELWSAQAQYYV